MRRASDISRAIRSGTEIHVLERDAEDQIGEREAAAD
jgi:hypothetical protein